MESALASSVGVSAMPCILRNAKADCNMQSCGSDKDWRFSPLQNARMAREADPPEKNHLRAWREFRHLTQDELAEASETNASVISLLESGARKLSPKWLRKLAPILNTSPGYLLDHDPNDLPTAILDVWADIPEESRPQALRVLESFKRTGTEG